MKSFLRKLYIYRFLDDFMLVYPVYVIMFRDAGIDEHGIATLLALWAGVGLLVGIPAGMLADRMDRKLLLTLVQPVRALGYLSWLIAGSSFWLYLLGFVLWGIKGAVVSNTFPAYVYDELAAVGKQDRYESVLGRLKFCELAAIGSSVLLGGFAVDRLGGYSFVLWASVIAVFAGAFTIMLLPSPRRVRSTDESRFFDLLRKVIREVKSNKVLFSTLAFATLIGASYGALDEYWELYYRDLGFSFTLVGVVSFSILVMQSLASLLAPKFRLGEQRLLGIARATILIGLLLILGLWINTAFSLVFVLLGVVGMTVVLIKAENILQQSIGIGERATVTSVSTFFLEIAVIGIYQLIGFFSAMGGLWMGLLAVGVLITAVGVLMWIDKLKR